VSKLLRLIDVGLSLMGIGLTGSAFVSYSAWEVLSLKVEAVPSSGSLDGLRMLPIGGDLFPLWLFLLPLSIAVLGAFLILVGRLKLKT
jgi:hypothetical protein